VIVTIFFDIVHSPHLDLKNNRGPFSAPFFILKRETAFHVFEAFDEMRAGNVRVS
jgi:hypothetical protein